MQAGARPDFACIRPWPFSRAPPKRSSDLPETGSPQRPRTIEKAPAIRFRRRPKPSPRKSRLLRAWQDFSNTDFY